MWGFSQEVNNKPMMSFEDKLSCDPCRDMWFMHIKGPAVCPLNPPSHPLCFVPNLGGHVTEHRGCHEWSVSPVDVERKMRVLTMPDPDGKTPPPPTEALKGAPSAPIHPGARRGHTHRGKG